MFTLLLASVALGTVGFEPAVPEARFTGEETLTQDGSTELWSAIERHRDPDESLFGQEVADETARYIEYPRSGSGS